MGGKERGSERGWVRRKEGGMERGGEKERRERGIERERDRESEEGGWLQMK